MSKVVIGVHRLNAPRRPPTVDTSPAAILDPAADASGLCKQTRSRSLCLRYSVRTSPEDLYVQYSLKIRHPFTPTRGDESESRIRRLLSPAQGENTFLQLSDSYGIVIRVVNKTAGRINPQVVVFQSWESPLAEGYAHWKAQRSLLVYKRNPLQE